MEPKRPSSLLLHELWRGPHKTTQAEVHAPEYDDYMSLPLGWNPVGYSKTCLQEVQSSSVIISDLNANTEPKAQYEPDEVSYSSAESVSKKSNGERPVTHSEEFSVDDQLTLPKSVSKPHLTSQGRLSRDMDPKLESHAPLKPHKKSTDLEANSEERVGLLSAKDGHSDSSSQDLGAVGGVVLDNAEGTTPLLSQMPYGRGTAHSGLREEDEGDLKGYDTTDHLDMEDLHLSLNLPEKDKESSLGVQGGIKLPRRDLLEPPTRDIPECECRSSYV